MHTHMSEIVTIIRRTHTGNGVVRRLYHTPVFSSSPPEEQVATIFHRSEYLLSWL